AGWGLRSMATGRLCRCLAPHQVASKGLLGGPPPHKSGRRDGPSGGSGLRPSIPTKSPDLPSSDNAAVAVSIVVPVRNEAENVAPLIAEITRALDRRWDYEIIYVNDGSTDATAERLNALMKQ